MSVINQDKTKVNSAAFFQHLWQVWKFLGIMMGVDERYRLIFSFYSTVLNIIVTICYPLHLCLMLFRSDNMSDNIKNLAVAVTCVACSVKFVVNTMKITLIRQFESLLNQLDSRIIEGPELEYFRRIRRLLRNIAFAFLGLYSIIGITAELAFIFSDERRLLYPAWFPFNWHESTLHFYLANIYQIAGISVLIIQNYVNDSFPAMAMCVLSGHIEILAIRLANIGYLNKTKKENEEDMVKCVKDLECLYELFTTIQSIISASMFIQFAVTAINLCTALVALLFYVSAPLDILYYFTYCMAMPLEIFPACYYGSDIQYRFAQLHRSLFRSNWTEQSPTFKRHMMIFIERSLRENVAVAGGMLRIHLDTFFSTCKGAYSLFAVIMRIN